MIHKVMCVVISKMVFSNVHAKLNFHNSTIILHWPRGKHHRNIIGLEFFKSDEQNQSTRQDIGLILYQSQEKSGCPAKLGITEQWSKVHGTAGSGPSCMTGPSDHTLWVCMSVLYIYMKGFRVCNSAILATFRPLYTRKTITKHYNGDMCVILEPFTVTMNVTSTSV